MSWRIAFLVALLIHSSSVAALKVGRSGKWMLYEQENEFVLMITRNERNHYLSYYCRLTEEQYDCQGVVSMRARCGGGDIVDFLIDSAGFSVNGKMACVASPGGHSRMFIFDKDAFFRILPHAEKSPRFKFTLLGERSKDAMFYSKGMHSAFSRIDSYLKVSGYSNAGEKEGRRAFVPRFPCIGSASFLPCQLRETSPDFRGTPYSL